MGFMTREGRTLDPRRPWPTARQEGTIIVGLIAGITFMQFELNALENLPEKVHMFWLWGFSGVFVALATLRIEKFFLRRSRSQ